MEQRFIDKLDLVDDNKFYKVAELKAILQNEGLNFSIFSIMNAETWKCLNYGCGKRYRYPITSCPACGSEVSEPIIPSPRTSTTGKGAGHRRYIGSDVKKIVETFRAKAAGKL